MKIVNVVAVGEVCEPFDLQLISQKIEGTKFATQANLLHMRMAPENYYVGFYKSNKFVITGFSKINLINHLSKQVIRILREAGIYVKLKSVNVVNLVFTDKIELKLPLDKLVLFLDDSRVIYEPEQFPWLLYKDPEGVSFTVFRSGKIIITGVRSVETAEKSFERFKVLFGAL
jgi:transcription initiation factor TFIID TATA-box-binding protein